VILLVPILTPPVQDDRRAGIRYQRALWHRGTDGDGSKLRHPLGTRLPNSGLSLGEIAACMGWSVRYAAAVIDHYAMVSPDETDAILVKLARAKGPAP